MKKKMYFIAAIVLGLVLSMTLINCEKDSDVSPIADAPVIAATNLETSQYISAEELEDLSYEVEKMSVDMEQWKRVPVDINLRTRVSYEDSNSKVFPHTRSIIFEGQGQWEDVGEVTYNEKVTLYTSPLEKGWSGEGVIALTKPNDLATVPRDNKLLFKSELRIDEMILGEPDDRILPRPSKVIKSKIEFNGGEGIYKDVRGRAYKLETYFENDKNHCNTYFQGYIYIRNRVAVGPQDDM